MRQVGIDPYDWGTSSEADDADCHTESVLTESRLSKRGGIMQTQYSSSSQESSIYCLDERSTPSPVSVEDGRDRSHSISDTSPNFLTLQLDRPFARRKASICSNTSSTDSTSLSLDGGSDTERNSTCYPAEYESVAAGATNKFDDIIDKIVGLRFSRSVRNSGPNGDAENVEKRSVVAVDSARNVVGNVNDVNGNWNGKRNESSEYWDDGRTEDDEDRREEEEDDDDDEDLVERGPVRPPGKHHHHQSTHGKPYYTLDWLAGTSGTTPQDQSYMSVYESTAQQILRNKQFSEKINPCLDKLSDCGQQDRSQSNFDAIEQPNYGNLNVDNGWASPEASYADNSTPSSSVSSEDQVINASIPSIVLNDPGEASLLEILQSGGFQAAQALSDTASVQNLSPGAASSENWPDSPASSGCNVLSSRSPSRASSRAQSPGSGANVGSPLLHINFAGGSPAESRANARNFRVGQALSSSESSNHSYADTPSPTGYQCALDQRLEERLGRDFESFTTWCQSCMSSGTVVNSGENIDVGIDSNELQLVEEVIRRDQSEKRSRMEEMQVVPKSETLGGRYEACCPRRVSENDLVPNPTNARQQCGQMRSIENVFDEAPLDSQSLKTSAVEQRSCHPGLGQFYAGCAVPQLGNTGALISNAQNNLVYPDLDDVYNLTYSNGLPSNIYGENSLNAPESLMDFENSMENFLPSHYHGTTTDVNNSTAVNSSGVVASADPMTPAGRLNDLAQINGGHACYAAGWRGPGGAAAAAAAAATTTAAKSTFNDFQIPETVSSYRQNRSRRTSERSIAPWPCLNLPMTGASERLKAGLEPKEVEKAMINLLKKPTEEWAAGDEDGDTMLMCLVGNPSELEEKKAYLAPLVERLGSLSGALTMTNNRNEDALYLAAMNCPQMAYVTGYLAAAMLQRGFDVSQRLYNTKGDTLIHAVAAKGDTHGAVLAELLSLRTLQGNAVFDLSKRNYDGRTPLHVAVESHGQAMSGMSSIGTTRLLLENGADQSIKETKCGDTALHMAVALCADPALVKALLNNNGREAVNVPNYNKNTPVHMAAALSSDVPIDRHMEICMHLIQAGGLTNIQNRQGKTPLALVCTERKEAIKHIFHKKA